MTRFHIKIKQEEKAIIVLDLLKELPFVEIEKSQEEKPWKPASRGKKSLEDLFGLWENREVSVADIRKKAWARNDDTL